MPTARTQIYSDEEAARFAAIMAGFDTTNPSDAEANGKGRLLRRMAAQKGLRIVDALELPEIREAIDEQMQPIRMEMPDIAALEAEIDDLRGKIAIAVPKVTELAEIVGKLTCERERFMRRIAWLVTTSVCFLVGLMTFAIVTSHRHAASGSSGQVAAAPSGVRPVSQVLPLPELEEKICAPKKVPAPNRSETPRQAARPKPAHETVPPAISFEQPIPPVSEWRPLKKPLWGRKPPVPESSF